MTYEKVFTSLSCSMLHVRFNEMCGMRALYLVSRSGIDTKYSIKRFV